MSEFSFETDTFWNFSVKKMKIEKSGQDKTPETLMVHYLANTSSS